MGEGRTGRAGPDRARSGSPGRISLGPLSYTFVDGGIRHVRWHGVEVLRGLSAPIRDASWGTSIARDVVADDRVEASRAYHRYEASVMDGAARVATEVEIDAGGMLEARFRLDALRALETNRAGFTLLHPLLGVAGQDGEVVRPDGSCAAMTFPEAIAPTQPVRDIAGLRHAVRGVRVEIAMEGEVFEMEDQRNWSDASYKTYCRPLALPTPLRLAPGDVIEQTVQMSVSGQPHPAPSPDAASGETSGADLRLPDVLLAVEPDWLSPNPIAANGVLMRWTQGGPARWTWSKDALLRLREVLGPAYLDLEVVIPEGADASRTLVRAADALAEADLAPRHVVALPEAYLKSYQPEGPWPSGTDPEAALHAAVRAFPSARVGAGMLTNFTELNRRRPDGGDYVTHGNAAIVHAADDVSVVETLEAMGDVFADGMRIAGARGYRLGLVAIGMRTNPYGPTLADNAAGARIAMTGLDPRQATSFAAAYAVVALALAARAGAEAICLGAPRGPFGVEGPGGATPLGIALARLSALAGAEVELAVAPPAAVIRSGGRTIEARPDAEATVLVFDGFGAVGRT